MQKNIFTVDVEDWFHILDFKQTQSVNAWSQYESRIEKNLNWILQVCSEYKIHGTFFILGWVAKKYPELVRLISDCGHEIGCHSNEHRLVYEMTENEFCDDLEIAKFHIEKACGKVPTAYRAPGFSIRYDSTWAFENLVKHGFKVDCSVFPTSRSHGGLPNYHTMIPHKIKLSSNESIICLPINYTKFIGLEIVYSGGGYFRLLPYSLINLLMKRSEYNMTYFHPRDFDFHQPRLENMSLYRHFKCYVGLKGSQLKLRRILRDYEFLSVDEYLQQHPDLETRTL